MLSTAGVALAVLLWMALLFAVALGGERRGAPGRRGGALVYSLSLAIYCTSWTFYGTVAQAVDHGWWLPPTFLGTILIYLFGLPLLERLRATAQAGHSTSVADFIASRLGQSSGLAALITGVALVGMVPYIALQLKAVAMSYAALVAGSSQPPAWQDSAFYVAVVMALFAMLFGTRRTAAGEANRGLLLAMAFEAVFKLVCLLAVGAFALWAVFEGPADLAAAAEALPLRSWPAAPASYFTLAVLGALAMVCLPHQFHVGVVECTDGRHLRTARWAFPAFLVLISLPVWPLAAAGSVRLQPQGVPADLYVLSLPLLAGARELSLLAFLGGIAAATGMVILAALSLSIMLGNHWITPWLLHRQGGHRWLADVRRQRRVGIALVLALGYGYSRALGGSGSLAGIGAQSFSALAQLAPALLLALYRPHTSVRAVAAGLASGFLVWAYVLILPLLWPSLAAGFEPPLRWLGPDTLLGLAELDPLSRAVWSSLGVNLLVLLAVQRWAPGRPRATLLATLPTETLRRLALRFLDEARLRELIERAPTAPVEAEQRVAQALTAVIGAASTRLLLDTARAGSERRLEQVADLVGEASQALRFNQRILEAALENMSQGISVVDPELRLVAWNRRYVDLFGFPAELMQVGRPIAELADWAVQHGFAGHGDDPAAAVQRRLEHMRRGSPHLSERRFPDGSVVEIRGTPMPGGGFVATFTDVTAFRRAEVELKQANETLEQRVEARTRELAAASAAAERANRGKSRFLAAVSHDLAQPLNAARLFSHALNEQLAELPQRATAQKVDSALASAESLLAGLLEMSRLQGGALQPNVQVFRLNDVLQPLAEEFTALAADKGLRLHWQPCRAFVLSDPALLRRVLQNFLANAVRHTRRGRVLLGCRRRGEAVRIEVWDTGPGIAEADRASIFEEFRRLDRGGQGLGLGLAIADKIARLLGHPLHFESWPGRGSVFGLGVPCVPAPALSLQPVAAAEPATASARLLVVDNDAAVAEGMRELLGGWGYTVALAHDLASAQAALAEAAVDALLLDYHLDHGVTGLGLREQLGPAAGRLPALLISADHDPAIRAEAEVAGLPLLYKPLKPLALKSLLSRWLAGR